jgi:hypothetical protein
MACKHKFYDDLKLQYCNWNIDTLIIGTFNPEWPKKNHAEWFYGRKTNNFWYVLPKIYGENDLTCSTTESKKEFCCKYRIGITDLISCIKTADDMKHLNIISSFSDKAIQDNFKLENLELVNVLEIIKKNSTIKNVYLTRSATGIWKKIWDPIRKHCIENNIKCEELITPSNYAFFQYKIKERGKHPSLEDFIYSRWKEKWH